VIEHGVGVSVVVVTVAEVTVEVVVVDVVIVTVVIVDVVVVEVVNSWFGFNRHSWQMVLANKSVLQPHSTSIPMLSQLSISM
jgi:hypothetical protein